MKQESKRPQSDEIIPFPETGVSLWAAVTNAARNGEHSKEAVDKLCLAYRPAMLKYFQLKLRHENEAINADDLTGGFVLHLQERNRFTGFARRPDTRFRAYLITAMKRFFLDHLRKKRGQPPLDSLDDLKEQGFDPAAAADDSERFFDQNVARLFHERAMQVVRKKSEEAGKLCRFEALRRFIHVAEDGAYEQVAQELGLSLVNTRVLVHRMREDYFLSFRSLVFQTVHDQKEADTETRYLFELARELPPAHEEKL